jgi:dTDP-4-dehydrorhamnose reductase
MFVARPSESDVMFLSDQNQNGGPQALVVGSEGKIGAALIRRLESRGKKVMATTRRQDQVGADRLFLDIRSAEAIAGLDLRVAQAYLCAAVTSIAACAQDPAATWSINVAGIVSLACQLLKREAAIVFPSTSLVFDGFVAGNAHDDEICPTTEYGRQKAQAEVELLRLAGSVGIVRLTKVLPACFPLFQSWKRDLLAGRACHPYRDVAFAPIPLDFAVEALCRCAELQYRGIVQVSSETQVSYAEAAHRLALRLGVDPALVQPVQKNEGSPNAPSRTYETLDVSRLKSEFGLAPPDVWETLDKTFAAPIAPCPASLSQNQSCQSC